MSAYSVPATFRFQIFSSSYRRPPLWTSSRDTRSGAAPGMNVTRASSWQSVNGTPSAKDRGRTGGGLDGQLTAGVGMTGDELGGAGDLTGEGTAAAEGMNVGAVRSRVPHPATTNTARTNAAIRRSTERMMAVVGLRSASGLDVSCVDEWPRARAKHEAFRCRLRPR